MDNFKKVVAIQNYGPSGSLFLQSLFDGHPHILSTPALYMREFYRFWDEQFPFSDMDELIHKFVTSPYHAYWFDADKPYKVLEENGLLTLGENANENITIDINIFVRFLKSNLQNVAIKEITTRQFMIAIYLSYAQTINKPIHDDAWILFPIHANPYDYAKRLHDDFEIVRVIHMIRDPITLYYSVLKNMAVTNTNQHDRLRSVLNHVYFDRMIGKNKSEHKYYGFQSYFNDNENVQSRGVRLEDLHRESKKMLMQLCQWLNIPWDDCMLKSTFNGKLWNNKNSSIKTNGFGDADMVKQYHSQKTKLDLLRLSIIFDSHYCAFDYASSIDKNKKKILAKLISLLNLLPFKAEFDRWFLINYIRNRFYLFKIIRYKSFNYAPLLTEDDYPSAKL